MLATHYSLLATAALRGSADPAVVVPDFDHRGEDVSPRLLIHEHVIGEHAAVPADVFHLLRDFALLVAEPVGGVAGDVEFALRVGDLAMLAGLLVAAGAVRSAVVLGDVEID